jgi:hypothetical protein
VVVGQMAFLTPTFASRCEKERPAIPSTDEPRFHHHDEQQALSCSRTSMSASPQNQRCCTLPIMLLRSQATAEQRITGVPGCEAIQANAPTPKVHPLLVKISRNSDYMKRGSFIIGVNIFTDIDEYNLNYIC